MPERVKSNTFAIVKIKSSIPLIGLAICLACVQKSQAQAPPPPTLPMMSIVTDNAKNILSWVSQYDGVKSIAIQRSADSVRNFTTIGVLTNPKKGVQRFIDELPLAGKNHYRLSVNFAGDLEWFSNTYKVVIDSAVLANSLKGAIKSGTTNSIAPKNDSPSDPNEPAKPKEFYYTPSLRVYSNPYTGHINISLEDATSKKYSIRFFDPNKNEVLKISRIPKKQLILDKNNFNSRGTYQFQLFDGTELVETGYITIY